MTALGCNMDHDPSEYEAEDEDRDRLGYNADDASSDDEKGGGDGQDSRARDFQSSNRCESMGKPDEYVDDASSEDSKEDEDRKARLDEIGAQHDRRRGIRMIFKAITA